LTYESILLDAEVGTMIRQLLRPVEVSDEAFATELIQELGPGAVYLDREHTVRHMRAALSVPSLTDRESYDEWHARGARDRVEVARERVREILASHQPPPLPAGVGEQLREIVEAYTHGER
jgi:trimethylamine--corrinoid protein Co-methyltransferase